MASTIEDIKRRRVKVEYGIEDETGIKRKPMQAEPVKSMPDVPSKDAQDAEERGRQRDEARIQEMMKYMEESKVRKYVKENPSRR